MHKMSNKTIAALFAAGLFTGVAFAQPTALAPPKSAAPVDPKVAECRVKNQTEHKSIVEMYQKAKAGGKIDPKEAQAFAAMEGRLNAHAKFLARDGFSMADCATMAKDLEGEKANVTRMASTPAAPGSAVPPKGGPVDPKVAECRAKNQAEHKSIVDMYQKAKAGGKIDPKEAQAFAAMEGRLNAHAKFLARDGFSMADCATMAKDLASEKAAVAKMAGLPAAPAGK
jgi:glutathione S-transferase